MIVVMGIASRAAVLLHLETANDLEGLVPHIVMALALMLPLAKFDLIDTVSVLVPWPETMVPTAEATLQVKVVPVAAGTV